MVGPVVKIDPASLPQRPNIAYLGAKTYAELPVYAAGWDVALMPFAINAATRFISPTKTPEYLAAGLPVVSTPIIDVIRQYGKLEAVAIASNADEFVTACERMLTLDRGRKAAWRVEADELLSALSWNVVVNDMRLLIEQKRAAKRAARARPHYDYLVVGAGFAGAVMAERLAADAGKTVLVIDRRPHVAGNAFDHLDASGILIHQYGPHIFHTNSPEIVDYLSRFTGWRPYEHRVLCDLGDKQVPMPINRTTLNMVYGLDLQTEDDAEQFLASLAEPVETIQTSEDVVVSKVGRELYETFFRGYTRKQWGMDPSELDKSVTSRVPTRTNDDDRYFTDTFQAMPADGYTAMFKRILDHPNITSGWARIIARCASTSASTIWCSPGRSTNISGSASASSRIGRSSSSMSRSTSGAGCSERRRRRGGRGGQGRRLWARRARDGDDGAARRSRLPRLLRLDLGRGRGAGQAADLGARRSARCLSW
jgi:UDP-galactopyranose mutase